MTTWCVAMFYGPIGILLVFIMCDDVLIICFETLRLRWGFGGLLAFAGAYSCLVEVFLFFLCTLIKVKRKHLFEDVNIFGIMVGGRWQVSSEVETNYASFDFHFWVLFFRFSPFSTYCTFVNTVLTHIKIGTSVEWNCSNNLYKYWNTSTSFKHFTSTSNIWKSSHNLKRRFFESTLPILCFVV